jgi:large subunit ribosomal protein L16
MTRYARRGGKLWIRIFPDKPITMRPAETRMVSETVARAAMRIASFKMPIKTQFLIASTSK